MPPRLARSTPDRIDDDAFDWGSPWDWQTDLFDPSTTEVPAVAPPLATETVAAVVSPTTADDMTSSATSTGTAPVSTAQQTSAAAALVRAALLDVGLQALARGASATEPLSPVIGGLSLGHAPNSISADARYVTIDALARDGDGAALLVALQAIGLESGASFRGMASGRLPVEKVAALLDLDNLASAHESGSFGNAGTVNSQGELSLHADTARTSFGVDGSGLKIGILSDSFDRDATAATHMAQDIASGDLPASITLLQDDYAGGADEGRAMAQLVHDIAPGASILFATAAHGQAGFASNILALADAGAQIIVDDWYFLYEPMFQDGIIAQAIDEVVARGVTYFSSAGNNGRAGYESAFHAGGSGTINGINYTFHDFGTTEAGVPSTLLKITQDADTTYIFQWANAAASASPGVGAVTNLDFAGYSDPAATNELFHFTVDETGGDPINDLIFNGAGTFYLRIGLRSGPAPVDLKIVPYNDAVTFGANTTNINIGTSRGHSAAAGNIAVGAADYRKTPAYGVDPPTIHGFSSAGPTNIWVDAAGNILSAPQVRATPAITAPDGSDTTFFGFDTSDPGTLPNFYGTSASAPAAAAVALLMLQARPTLNAADIRNLLQDSAIDMDDPATPGFDYGYDAASGAGLIQADLAVGYAKTLTISASAAHPTMYGTHLADRLVGGPENDTFTGFAGIDTFVTAPGGLADTYIDFAAGAGGDIIELRGFAGVTDLQAVLDRTAQSGTDSVIDLGGGDTLTLANVLRSSLTTANFVFVSAGTAGDDSFVASSGNQRIDADGGIDTVTFGFRLVDAHVGYQGNEIIIDGPSGSHTVLTGVERFVFTDGAVDNADADVLVDDLFYYSQNHDVWMTGADADAHYHAIGWKQGKDPDAFFSLSTYLSRYIDIKAAGIDPLAHFDQSGWHEGRVPSILFDPEKYLITNPDVQAAGVDPLAHFLQFGAGEGRVPIAPTVLLAANGFDYVYYLQHNPDVAATHVDPFVHFETIGWKEGRNPNGWFDTAGYLSHNGDVAAAGPNPLDHYHQFGWQEGRDPSFTFDTQHYLAAYPDVAAAHVDPLLHFLQYGQLEGRSSFADGVWG